MRSRSMPKNTKCRTPSARAAPHQIPNRKPQNASIRPMENTACANGDAILIGTVESFPSQEDAIVPVWRRFVGIRNIFASHHPKVVRDFRLAFKQGHIAWTSAVK